MRERLLNWKYSSFAEIPKQVPKAVWANNSAFRPWETRVHSDEVSYVTLEAFEHDSPVFLIYTAGTKPS